MYISLRERYRNVVFFETDLYLRGRVEIDIPVVDCVDPGTDDEVYTTIGELFYGDRGGGFIKDPVVCGEDLFYYLFCLFEVVFVGDTNYHIDAPCAVDGVVHDVSVSELCVGDDDADIIRSV